MRLYEYNLSHKFQNTCTRFLNQTAIQFCDDTQLSYSELNQLSNQFCHYLDKKNVFKGSVICLSGHKDKNLYALILACLKKGIIYSIFDNTSPEKRLRKIFSTCCPSLILCEPSFKKTLNDEDFTTTFLIQSYDEIALDSFSTSYDETVNIDSNHPAYIMFTSGSTGNPKGALISHQNLLNFIHWAQNCYDINEQSVNTNVNPMYFDNSVFDFYSTIFSGAKLVVFPKHVVENPIELVRLVDKYECTQWFSVPSLLIYLNTMKVLTQDSFKSIKNVIFGGEGYPKSKLKNLFERLHPRVNFHNVYGPTECTCICSSHSISANDLEGEGFAPLGKLAPNFDYSVLTPDLNPTKPGEVGELHLKGPNVGLGYFNDNERTLRSFIQDPESPHFQKIIYKTGDLVKVSLKDNLLYFISRADNQIKHMGYRIELEEIEAAFNAIPIVNEAIVVQIISNSFSKLVAFISTSEEANAKDLKSTLKDLIPAYMIPSKIIIQDKLPKNPNGKIDRKHLKEIASNL